MYKMYKNKDKKTTPIDLRLFTLLDSTKYDDDQIKSLTAVVLLVKYMNTVKPALKSTTI